MAPHAGSPVLSCCFQADALTDSRLSAIVRITPHKRAYRKQPPPCSDGQTAGAPPILTPATMMLHPCRSIIATRQGHHKPEPSGILSRRTDFAENHPLPAHNGRMRSKMDNSARGHGVKYTTSTSGETSHPTPPHQEHFLSGGKVELWATESTTASTLFSATWQSPNSSSPQFHRNKVQRNARGRASAAIQAVPAV